MTYGKPKKSELALDELEGMLKREPDIEAEADNLCKNINQHTLGLLAADKQTLMFMRLMARRITTLEKKVANQDDQIAQLSKNTVAI